MSVSVWYEVASINVCKWFLHPEDAYGLLLRERARPNSLVECTRIETFPDGSEERLLWFKEKGGADADR